MALSEKEKHIGRYFDSARRRARAKDIPFNLTIEYLRSLSSDFCPIFHTPLEWGRAKMGRGKMKPNGAQLDRIVPELGYVIGNVAFISHRANRIKDNGTMQEHYDIADWIWNNTHATKKPTTPVSTGADSESSPDAKRRAVLAARLGKNYDHTYNHSRTVPRQDADHRAQESSGDSLGRGGQEVESLITLTRVENHGESDAEIIRLDFGRGHLPDQP